MKKVRIHKVGGHLPGWGLTECDTRFKNHKQAFLGERGEGVSSLLALQMFKQTRVTNLISGDDLDVAQTVLIRGELGDMLDKEIDDFDVALAEGGHEAANLTIVLAIHIGVCND